MQQLKSGQLPSLVGDFIVSVLSYHAHLLKASQREQGQIAVQQQHTDLQARPQKQELPALLKMLVLMSSGITY